MQVMANYAVLLKITNDLLLSADSRNCGIFILSGVSVAFVDMAS